MNFKTLKEDLESLSFLFRDNNQDHFIDYLPSETVYYDDDCYYFKHKSILCDHLIMMRMPVVIENDGIKLYYSDIISYFQDESTVKLYSKIIDRLNDIINAMEKDYSELIKNNSVLLTSIICFEFSTTPA